MKHLLLVSATLFGMFTSAESEKVTGTVHSPCRVQSLRVVWSRKSCTENPISHGAARMIFPRVR